MPPRKNTARRGRPFKFGEGGDRTASQDDAPSDAAAVASSDATEKPSPQAKKPAVPPRKGAAPKPSPAKPRAAAIEPAAKKRAVAAKPAAKKEDPTARTTSDASEADAEDDGAFEALVLDADDDDEVLAETAGDGETGVGDDSVPAGNEEGVAESTDQDAEGGDAGVGEADEAPGDDVVAEEGNGDYAGEPEEGAEGWQGDADGADYEDDGAAEVDPNEEGAEGEGGEAEYAEGDEMGDAEHPAEELEGDALGADAANDATEAGADDGAEALENGVSADPEHEESGDVAAAATGSGEGEGETIVGDLAPSERDFVMAEVEEIKDEPTTEVTRLWDLCPDVELDSAETITASVHDTIQRSVRQFIERLLRDAKETGTVPDDASAAAQDGKPVYGCNLCNVQMDQPELFDCHVESQRHIKRLRWMYFMGMNKELSKFHCRVCHISVPCKDHLVGHLRSDRHVCLSKSLNVHPKYSEHLLSQHFPKAKVKSLLQSQQQQQQQQPSATASQPSATGKGKEQKGADKRPDKGKANAGTGSGQQGKREQSPPPINSNFIFHCELCEVIGYNEDQIQEHYRGKKHRAKMAEELEKLSNKKQDTTKKAPAKGDGSGSQATKESPKGPAKGPGPNKKGPVGRPQQQQFRMKQGPKFGGGGPTYTCYVCNVVLHSTRDYSQHFTTRAHRMATGLQSSGPPFDRKRPRSPSPFSRPPAWSPPRMRSPPRDLWSGGPPQRKRSPEPFLDPMARDLFAPQSGPGGSFEPGFGGPQGGMLEDYGERRGPRGGGGSDMPDPSSVAATLETMIQLQQRLLNMTGPQDSGGYHDEEFKAVARNLQDMDLQKSLQQLRQSQRYNDSYSPGGDDRKGSYGMGGSFGGGGPGGSGGPRMNEYRKSSLGPTAPRPTGFGLPPMSHMRGSGGGASRY
ncbi:uncharacterized protein [Dermacentor albipictus]|uniref:uncharacterized protein isoform X3 n=1 Tax=Dermacentor albipictus TaxID=60249 RepID=UPI0031FCC4D8